MRPCDAEIDEQLRDRLGCHRGAAVGVQGELILGHALRVVGGVDEFLGEFAGLSGELAKEFIDAAYNSQGVAKDQLTLHADRGTSMTSKPVAQLLVDLGVARSHSRPHVSNDNPYSEANFKTLKYCPAFPGRFGSIQDARTFCAAFFEHYNHIHRHAGIGLHTAASVHYGTATEIRAQRVVTLDAAYAANPARFRHRRPHPPKLPTVAWITQPSREALIQNE